MRGRQKLYMCTPLARGPSPVGPPNSARSRLTSERSGRFAVITESLAVVSFKVLMATTAAGCDLQQCGLHSLQSVVSADLRLI